MVVSVNSRLSAAGLRSHIVSWSVMMLKGEDLEWKVDMRIPISFEADGKQIE